MMRMMAVLFLAVSVFSSVAKAQECYFTAGYGQSTITAFASKDIERNLFDTDYTSSTSREDDTSTTGELGVGCVMSHRYGVRAELSHFDGFKHVVQTRVNASFEEFSEDFDVTRTIRARGYLLSGVWEFPVGNDYHLFGRLGAAYVHATGTITAFDSPFALQASKSDFVPVIGVGARRQINDQWSAILEYRAVGHYDVRNVLFSVQYYFGQ